MSNASEKRLKTAPHNEEIEKAVLGAMIINPAKIYDIVKVFQDPMVFHSERNQLLYSAIMEVWHAKKPVDLVTVGEALLASHTGRNKKEQEKSDFEKIGGTDYLAEVLDSVASSENAPVHAEILKTYYTRRRLINASNVIIAEAMKDSEDVEDVMTLAEEKIFELSKEGMSQDFQPVKQPLWDTLKLIEELGSRKDEESKGVPSGFKDLDDLLGGFQPGHMVVIAGRPGMGKTAFALAIARNAAMDHGKGVGIFSLEMSMDELVMRMLCSEARVNGTKIKKGFMSEKTEWPRLVSSTQRLSEAKIFIDETGMLTLTELTSKARRMVMEHDVKMIIVDYLQLMYGRQKVKYDSRQAEIADISRNIKIMSKELKVPVIALSQLNRAVETRGGDKRPQLADLRESGAIEQDADVALFVWRDIYDKDEDDNLNKDHLAEILIRKNRHGPQGKIFLTFTPEFARFDPAVSMRDMREDDAAF